MTRQEFLRKATIMGLGSSLIPAFLGGCEKQIEDIVPNFQGKVLVIGAGAAGLMAGYTLNRHGIDFQIIEASDVYGGRVKKIEGFADFPIDLGAEWIHTHPRVFGELVNDESKEGEIEVISYRPKTIHAWKDGSLRTHNWVNHFYREYKFKNTTWYDFFESYIVPGIEDKILYNKPVAEIDYTGEKVQVIIEDGTSYEADRVLVTVPLSILKQDKLAFSPALPQDKIEAMKTVDIPPGIKVFVEFSERFYPDILTIGGLLDGLADSSPLYYDAAFKKDSNRNILGLFWVDPAASRLTELSTDQAIIDDVLRELDEVYEGKASQTYVKHVVQNWSAEPYILGSYSHYTSNYSANVATLQAPLENKVFFAGEALIDGPSSTVHGAGFSAVDAIGNLLTT